MTGIKPIEDSRKTLSSQVYDRIRQAIMQQELPPGERIDQNQLAEDLNVSLVPVREALKSLEAEGLVTIVPRRGAFVTTISLTDLRDLYFARQLIEGEAIYYACKHLTSEDFAELRKLIQTMRRATNEEDIREFMRLNRTFHMQIYGALDNPHIMQMIESLWERSEMYRYRFMFVSHSTETIHAEHEALLNACEKHDQDTAKQLAMAHIRHTQEGLELELKNQLKLG